MVQSIEMDDQIRAVIAACDLVKARKRNYNDDAQFR